MILASAPLWTLPFSALAALAYALPALVPRHLSDVNARRLLWLAWVLHAISLLVLLMGPVRFGFAPALSVTAWLVVLAYMIETQFFPKLRVRWSIGGLGAVTVVLAWVFPGALLTTQASAWLPLHFALGLSAYGMFAAAVVHAWLMTRTEHDIRQAQEGSSGLPLLAKPCMAKATTHGAGTTNASLPFCLGSPLPPCWWAAANGAGGAVAPCGCFTSVRACCCCLTRVRALYWKS